ncbi:hypothetical protein CHLRE_14g612976v5 [Chlamydomonas reinhardtii]|uniref:Uncharacterized protein n=1 Tax=Chlamydomonas reinhardtii TaxID=3055 RepID=A0A2K3CXF6_CHLRE|nr:uncharacterized protein CHLRE_14g612976v5 [Chlamydomonas reinhardtii]PNW72950.1 hypothetical protein CHLRE_14g612976v5 [Chlamydomonas reinhardtii]
MYGGSESVGDSGENSLTSGTPSIHPQDPPHGEARTAVVGLSDCGFNTLARLCKLRASRT